MMAPQGHQAAAEGRGAFPPPAASRRAVGLLLAAALLAGAGYAPLPSLPALPLPPAGKPGASCGDNRGGCFAKPPPWAPHPRQVPGVPGMSDRLSR
jgi:hypothetical protein